KVTVWPRRTIPSVSSQTSCSTEPVLSGVTGDAIGASWAIRNRSDIDALQTLERDYEHQRLPGRPSAAGSPPCRSAESNFLLPTAFLMRLDTRASCLLPLNTFERNSFLLTANISTRASARTSDHQPRWSLGKTSFEICPKPTSRRR